MKIIEQFLTAEIDITEFVNTLKVNPDLKETIKHLIPREAITDHNHVLWQTISYSGYERDDYDCLKHIQRICRFDGSIGDNLNLFGSIQSVYYVLNPSFRYTTKYEDALICIWKVYRTALTGRMLVK